MNINTSNFNFQGVGTVNAAGIPGCTDINATNFDGTVAQGWIDDGSCILPGFTHIPDDNFRAKLELEKGPLTWYNNNINDPEEKVLTSEIALLQTLDISSSSIADLTGIEDFITLIELRCKINQLTTIDTTQNTALTYLNCRNNQLTTTIDVNTALIQLHCQNNQLTSLDISANTALTHLNCGNNQLANLNVNTNGHLTHLECDNNLLTNLNLNNNTSLYHLECDNNQLTSLGLSNNTALIHLECNNNQLGGLDVSNNTSLTTLWCQDNLLYGLDVRNGNNDPNITNSNFNTTNNPNLTCISVDVIAYSETNWFNIDVGHNFSDDCLTAFGCTDPNADAGYDPAADIDDGSCIYYGCTDPLASNYDPNANTNDGSCIFPCVNYTRIPDANFRAKLHLSYDVMDWYDADGGNLTTGTVGEWCCTGDISGIGTLMIYNESISDLTGIEDFTALTFLHCHGNQITSLDLSQNHALTKLVCGSNQLTNLDVSQNTALTWLQCHSNQLTDLDVSANIALTLLHCNGNSQITSLDVSNNLLLEDLGLDNNSLTDLDVSANTALTTLYVEANSLTSLDLSNNGALTYLDCKSNQPLSSLDVRNGNNMNMSGVHFELTNNPNLFCIDVDDPVYSTANWTNVDSWVSFSNDCSVLGCPAIGDTHQDGIVFYVDNTDCSGLIAAPADQSTGTEWGCYLVDVSGADSNSDGAQNTLDIVNEGCGVVVDLCVNYNGGGYNDWFLPSKDELSLMYVNLHAQSLGGFSTDDYWSSTEISSLYAYTISFLNSGQHWGNKNSTYSVRAIRAF